MADLNIALLTDVHGNRFALEAVLADIEREGPDQVANLGDVVWGAGDPAGAWELLEERDLPTVRGNTDEKLQDGDDPLTRFVRGALPRGASEALRALPTTLTLADGEVLLAHGTPESPHVYLMFDEDEPSPREKVRERLGDLPAAVRVVAVGHSHLEAVARFGNVLAVNVGAVSRQKDSCPDARWVLLTRRRGLWGAEFRCVPYDIEAAARWTEQNEPGGAQLARNLRTGRR